MNEWNQAIAQARGELLEEFARRGFTVRTSTLVWGEVSVVGRDIPVPVDIALPPGFPYEKPKVRPTDGSGGVSWHRERDGSLCLWSDEDSGDLPWLTVDAIIQRIQEWYEMDAQGWPNDSPDLDLQRYWPRRPGLLVYEDLHRFTDREAALQVQRNGIMRVRPVLGGSRRGLRAAVFDAGEIVIPLRCEDDILALAGSRRAQLDWDIRTGRIRAILVLYVRAGVEGVLALVVTSTDPLTMCAVAAADEGPGALTLRCGRDRSILENANVAIVGLGAVGSLAADLLARAGVNRFTLVDDDLVRPGNCVRHLAGPEDIGRPKVDVVKSYLVQRLRVPGNSIAAQSVHITAPAEAQELLLAHDVVLDATASQLATALLMDGGRALNRPVVSVCLQRDGGVLRVDQVPLTVGQHHAPAVPPTEDGQAPLREGGCGDPLSAAPMWAVTAAASHAVAVVCDILCGRHEYPPSYVEVLALGDGLYDHVGTLP